MNAKADPYIPKILIWGILALLVLVNSALAFTYIHPDRFTAARTLKVSVLNIGQGDSILVTGPTGRTMLVDGGPDRSVLRALSSELSPLDRHIDMIVETHPDADHITGLISVLQQYSVGAFMSPGIPDATKIAGELQQSVSDEKGVAVITAERGMRIDLGGGAYADVLTPDRNMAKQTETNDGSVVMHVVYGNTSFMLTGDMPTTVENWLVTLDANDSELVSTVLKAGHHGSKYSTGAEWLTAVMPQMIGISVGLHNKYGHPSPEALARMSAEGGTVYETEKVGTIDFISNGQTVTEKSKGL